MAGESVEREPLRIAYDSASDVLEIEGVKYSGDLFRRLGDGPMGIQPSSPDEVFKIVKREDGTIIIRVVRDAELGARFDQHFGEGPFGPLRG